MRQVVEFVQVQIDYDEIQDDIVVQIEQSRKVKRSDHVVVLEEQVDIVIICRQNLYPSDIPLHNTLDNVLHDYFIAIM